MGAYGTVWRARDTQLDRLVAIKVPRAGNLPDGYELDRFLREARNAAQLRHPAIVPVHDVGREDHGMDESAINDRLSRIATLWTELTKQALAAVTTAV